MGNGRGAYFRRAPSCPCLSFVSTACLSYSMVRYGIHGMTLHGMVLYCRLEQVSPLVSIY